MTRESKFETSGTKFRLFPQAPVLPAFQEPETVQVSPSAGSIESGPADHRMYVVDALDKARPYMFPYLPPYKGPTYPAAVSDEDGHFDHLKVGTREFNAAHMYGSLRFVLDIWEGYFGRPIEWHFSPHLDRLELIPQIDWDNAQSGYGFIETGFGFDEDYGEHPFCLNFDILAHELGHSIIFSVVGMPPDDRVGAEYLGFQESASDIVALLSTLHFNSVVDHLLAQTRGNIFAPNILNRFAELSPTKQIRSASNSLRMSDVADVRTPVERLSQPERHRLAQPLTGAMFDVLVELFQGILVERGLISAELDMSSRRMPAGEGDETLVQSLFDEAFQGNNEPFAEALIDARDVLGRLSADVFGRLSPDLTFADVGGALLEADDHLTDGNLRDVIVESFSWRGIFDPPRRSREQRAFFLERGHLVKGGRRALP